jgi:hypothetical protein
MIAGQDRADDLGLAIFKVNNRGGHGVIIFIDNSSMHGAQLPRSSLGNCGRQGHKSEK